MSINIKAAALGAWPIWLAASGGGVDVSIDGRATIKGIRMRGESALSMERGYDVPQPVTIKLKADEAGEVRADGNVTVNGTRMYVSQAPHTDVAGAFMTLECTETRPVSPEVI